MPLTVTHKRPAEIYHKSLQPTQTTARFPVRLSLDPDLVGDAVVRCGINFLYFSKYPGCIRTQLKMSSSGVKISRTMATSTPEESVDNFNSDCGGSVLMQA